MMWNLQSLEHEAALFAEALRLLHAVAALKIHKTKGFVDGFHSRRPWWKVTDKRAPCLLGGSSHESLVGNKAPVIFVGFL